MSVHITEDLKGQRYGRLVAIEQAEDYIDKNNHHRPRWKCKCDCGKEVIVRVNDLKTGNTTSCGCSRLDWAKINPILGKRKYNIYEFKEDYGICYTEDKKYKWLFDKEDYEIIKPYYWTINGNKPEYAIAKDSSIDRTIIMSRLVMGLNYGDKEEVDHINHDVHDNRKQNLRICNRAENNWNISIRSNNKSGVTGVFWNKSLNKWLAYLVHNKKRYNLGYFTDFNEAVKTRKEAEEKYFGEYSYDNSMKKAGEINDLL